MWNSVIFAATWVNNVAGRHGAIRTESAFQSLSLSISCTRIRTHKPIQIVCFSRVSLSVSISSSLCSRMCGELWHFDVVVVVVVDAGILWHIRLWRARFIYNLYVDLWMRAVKKELNGTVHCYVVVALFFLSFAFPLALNIYLECERRLNVSRTSIATLSTPSNTHILICSNNEQIKTNDVLPVRYFGPVSCLPLSFRLFSFIALAFPRRCDHLLSCLCVCFFFRWLFKSPFFVVAVTVSFLLGARHTDITLIASKLNATTLSKLKCLFTRRVQIAVDFIL